MRHLERMRHLMAISAIRNGEANVIGTHRLPVTVPEVAPPG